MRHSIQIGSAIAVACLALPAVAQVSGSGTAGDVPIWTNSTTLGNSVVSQNGHRIGINFKSPKAALDVATPNNNTAVSGYGGSAPGGSDQNGSNALVGHGGAADPDSGFAAGGIGVYAVGGASS